MAMAMVGKFFQYFTARAVSDWVKAYRLCCTRSWVDKPHFAVSADESSVANSAVRMWRKRRSMNCNAIYDAAFRGYLLTVEKSDSMPRLYCDTIGRRRPMLLHSTVIDALGCHRIGPSWVHSTIRFSWRRSLITGDDGIDDGAESALLGHYCERRHVSQGLSLAATVRAAVGMAGCLWGAAVCYCLLCTFKVRLSG